MKAGILGTGIVGNTIGSKLFQLGHEVKMGSRTASNEKAVRWAKTNGSKASNGTFADAASFWTISLQLHGRNGFVGSVETGRIEESQRQDTG